MPPKSKISDRSDEPLRHRISELREAIHSDASQYGPLTRFVLIPDSLNKAFVGRIVSPSAECRSVVASRYQGLIVGETVYFVVPMS